MPLSGPLIDHFGRVHTDLRVSVTDRCNIRCFYCMPAEGIQFRPHSAILTFEEIERVVRVAAKLGIRKVRLTGGEPLVRRGIWQLVAMLAAIPGISDLAMTTNGILLPEYAGPLKAAGLRRLNISLDTLDPARFREISRREDLPRVLLGIEAALRIGFAEIKLNAVPIRGRSEDELPRLAEFARERGLELRFIEVMPLDGDKRWSKDSVLSGREILEILTSRLGALRPIVERDSRAPATEYEFVEGGGRIGVITTVSEPFCARCNRLRLTAEGQVRNCLFSPTDWDARSILRSGGADEELAALFHRAVGSKKERHGTDAGQVAPTEHAMHQIGG